jgi:hypothetical protein
MKKTTLALSILSTFVVTSQLHAASLKQNDITHLISVKPIKSVKITQPSAPIKKIITPSMDNLVIADVPQGFIEQKPVHFSQRISATNQISLQTPGYQAVSDEYWFEVTGEQLNNGIDLAVSTPGALIRLSGKHVKGQFSPAAITINPEQIEVLKGNNALTQAIEQTVSQEALATANIFPNSSAIKLNKAIGKGDFKLKVKQKLMANQRYIVNVKEKGSEHKLNLALPKQSYIQGEKLSFSSAIQNNSGTISNVTNNAYIKMPSGEKQAVNFTQSKGQYQLEVPTSLTEAKRGELYELHIESKGHDNGLTIRRNAKVAFAIAKPTARLEGELTIKSSGANTNLIVASEGRYEISGLLYGSDKTGKQIPMMLSRSAYYLTPGEHNIELRFDNTIMKTSGLSAPYSLKNIRLIDQSRLAVIQTL